MSVDYQHHAAHFLEAAQKHLNQDHSKEYQRGFHAGILAAAENIEASAKLFPSNEQTQFALAAAADMKAHAQRGLSEK